jgi:hypothetical protein
MSGRSNDQLNISYHDHVNNIRDPVLKDAAWIVVGCDPFYDQLLDREDRIPRLWSNFEVFQSEVGEDGSMNFELDLQVLRVGDLLGNEVSQSEKNGLVKYDG